MSEKKKSLEIEYKDRKCLICDSVHVTSLLISLHKRMVVLCLSCAKELKEYIP